ncbi:fungal-specific transcription factor domain-containing protein [Stachybotrys elegans]|uniref:Fungal-specific transcription factor domain-containing protein n=1 Tax=Stachybotrys elegans TaxID=80388 RepID=A0A8K0SRD5_9HYPO|nr:fungal-specific transcription factor domain-containing protein [Stachybotrys elegans]
MTASISQQTMPVKDASAIRKRRRRAPAGGAADDCFTCTKRNVKCDRRRPYCSQCLEVGNECSGYKTQLTWGVGVASRGKLRGLSLPVVKAPPVSREPKKSPATRPRTSSTNSSRSSQSSMTPPWSGQDEVQQMSRGPIDIPVMHHHHHHGASHASNPGTPYHAVHAYDYLSIPHQEHSPAMHQNGWASMPYSTGMMHSPHAMPKYNTKYPLPIITDGLSSSIDSLGSEVDYASPISHSSQPPTGIMIDHSRAPLPCHGLIYAPSEPSSSLNSHVDAFESHIGHKMMRESEHLRLPEVDAYATSYNSTTSTAWLSPRAREYDPIKSPQSENATSQWPSAAEPASISVSQDFLAKMPFFIDYYKMTMCPSMVFVDGPENPFRDNLLQLAVDSRSLQHAICALAACNLRMKRKLSLGQDTGELYQKLKREQHALEAMTDAQPEDQSQTEEYQHRNLAVHLLNQQLNDPAKSTHDSVLATILLLCHYRMMESGIAKFHTQFAGVKKILALQSQKMKQGGDSSWMEAIFTYFDAITASINDREAQLTCTSGTTPSLPLGAENLVGCDRELFKTISKLGRLNLLSQHRTVQNIAPSADASNSETPRSQSPLHSPLGHMSKSIAGALHDMNNLPSHRFDGNGFGSTLNDEEMMASAMDSSLTYDDQRTMFWGEWREARVALQNWQFDATGVAASLPSSATAAQVRDLGSLSEAFRYAALLFMERLANPNLPSSHSNFQNLVSQVVYYATSLENGSGAEKFLLWPLFVAGSECVNELQQNIVRTKCRDIMSRSGYMNNLAALDVLEKLWAGEFGDRDARSPGLRPSGLNGPFNWTRCIAGSGAGVEWIMF